MAFKLSFVLLLSIAFACPPHCASCNGNMCTSCVQHAIHQHNNCLCDDNWFGDLCSAYVGQCDSKCITCDGPSASDCTYCIDHAYRNNAGYCACESNWGGAKCNIFMVGRHGHNHHPTHAHSCDPKCVGGCTGPSSADCVRCVYHAELSAYGVCECKDGWTGPDCSTAESIVCCQRCQICYGTRETECSVCATHAHFNNEGICLCDNGYSGNQCENHVVQSDCHPRCEGACSGPGPEHCFECVRNAVKDGSGACSCLSFWANIDCSLWMGTCDAICKSVCNGPLPSDCGDCVANANELVTGGCQCKPGFVGDKCDIFSGECQPICYGCNGPSILDCKYCTEHATKNEFGVCECDRYWIGLDCSSYLYTGQCDPMCNGCRGDGPDQCTNCIEHAFMDAFGYCQCEAGWSGNQCGTYNFMGSCHPSCLDWFGPDATDCVECVPNSIRSMNSTCVWEEYWTGDDCSRYQYLGKCSDLCLGDDCGGPGAGDCHVCVPHASFDYYGICTCDEGWAGYACMTYMARCNPICNGCNGPDPCDCISCVEHAHVNSHGSCECDSPWVGADCSSNGIPCHPICAGACWGIGAGDCIDWVNNAYRSVDGTCHCNPGFNVPDCVNYSGECHAKCTQCHGPGSNHCDYCVPNAYFDEYNTWVCAKYYDGDDCSNYSGPCHPVCSSCDGPNANDCLSCVEHAGLDANGECSCEQYWDGIDCQTYVGECYNNCLQCTGPDPCDCTQCVANAEFDSDGLCVCTDYYTGYACTEYIGKCDHRCIGCFGGSNLQCDECVRNAFRSEEGKCECNAEWRDEDCSVYAGQCHPTCSLTHGCFGPEDSDCMACRPHSTLDSATHRCLCDEYWSGVDCQQYRGQCGSLCDGCRDETHCEVCVKNAHRDSNGDCTCNSGWGGSRCSDWSEDCWPTCDTCFGPNEDQCNDCVDHAVREDTGMCKCAENWGKEDCSVYAGTCDPICFNGCSGPGPRNCIQCMPNAVTFDNACQCETNWGSSDCSLYTGPCTPKCTGCTGPETDQCNVCIPNANRNEITGICECKTGWTGATCEQRDQCDPICALGCKGPSKTECYLCVSNAHRNLEGTCECDDDWTGPDCTCYDGPCHGYCDLCVGPTDSDCIACRINAYEDPTNGRCYCAENWIGSQCDVWQGPCAGTCLGCTGPTTLDCVDCKKNAYYEAHGGCLCADGWSGDTCQIKRQADCHPTCLTCNSTAINMCIQCAPGFTMVNGYCVPCHADCKTCTGQSVDQCDSCHPKFAISDGQCKECHPSCKKCSTIEIDGCEACFQDSTMNWNSGKCTCDFPKFRHPTAFTCENYCPSGFADSSSRECMSVTNQAIADFEFDQPLPIYNDGTDENIWATSCDPPVASYFRGSYFNGTDQFIQIQRFEAFRSLTIEIWAKVLKGNSSLLQFDGEFFSGWNNLDPESCDVFLPFEVVEGVFDFWVSECDSLIVDFGTERMVSHDWAYTGGWANFAVTLEAEFDTSAKLYVNGEEAGSGEFTTVLYRAITNNYFLGSHSGKIFGLTGYIYQFIYYNHPHETFAISTDCPGECSLCPDANICLNDCASDEYLDHEGECEPCHESCNHGCSSGDVCYECHPTCRTCIGPQVDQCIDCWCDAHRDIPTDEASCCACDAGFEEKDGQCQIPSCTLGCSVCLNATQCLFCSIGFMWSDHECLSCNDAYCDWNDSLPVCEEKGPREHSGSCTCGENATYDGYSCRVCSENCLSCSDDSLFLSCEYCKDGYHMLQDSEMCVNYEPTGYSYSAEVGEYLTMDSTIFEVSFDHSDNILWSYDGEWENAGQIWTVYIYGGDESQVRGVDDPFLTSDRGMWHDGRYNFMTFADLTLSHTWTIEVWINPVMPGTIFSSNKVYDTQKEYITAIGLTENKIYFSDRKNNFYSKTDMDVISYDNAWKNILVAIEWSQFDHLSVVQYTHNNILVDSALYPHIFEDKPDYIHLIATQETQFDKTNMLRGFIYYLGFFNTAKTTASEWQTSCSGCAACPNNGTCLGTCRWNQYDKLGDGNCQRCSMWCDNGCLNDGNCPDQVNS